MTKTQLPCIAIESFVKMDVRWFTDGKLCQDAYEKLTNNLALGRSTITRFELTVDDEIAVDRIEQLVENAVCDGAYVPLQQRHGTDKVFVESEVFQTQQWQRIHAAGREIDPGFKQHLIEQAKPHQEAFSVLMKQYGGNPVGVECRSQSRNSWAFVCQNVQTEYSKSPWRIQYFDENGMTGHECYGSVRDAIEAMVSSYQLVDSGALDRVSVSPQWAIGLKVQMERDLLNRGVIGFAEFIARCKTICNVETHEMQGEAV